MLVDTHARVKGRPEPGNFSAGHRVPPNRAVNELDATDPGRA